MPDTCENWPHIANHCVQYAHQPCENYQVLLYSVDLKAPEELWNPMSKTVHTKCSSIWNKLPVNIWNDRKAEKEFVRGNCKYFS